MLFRNFVRPYFSSKSCSATFVPLTRLKPPFTSTFEPTGILLAEI